MKRLAFALAAFASINATTSSALEFNEGHTGGNCSGCSWIAAEGEIEPGDVARLEQFIATNQVEYLKLIRINSLGGDVAAALGLGTWIRAREMNVTVGETFQFERDPAAGRDFQSYRSGVCASACVFVLMGGVHREMEEGSLVGVHQFAPVKDSLVSSQESTSATQRMLASLTAYVVRMGVDPDILLIASGVQPADVSWLDIGFMEDADLLTTRSVSHFALWNLQPVAGQLTAITRQIQSTGETIGYAFTCDALFISVPVKGNRVAEVSRSVRSARFAFERRADSHLLQIEDISYAENDILVRMAGGSRLMNLVANSDDSLNIAFDMPRVYASEFGELPFFIPSSNLAELAPHVISSCDR